VPLTLKNIKADLEDGGARFDGEAPNLGDDPREGVDGRRGWWTE
jgi:hypothetical protein